jgi:hypothetical protein
MRRARGQPLLGHLCRRRRDAASRGRAAFGFHPRHQPDAKGRRSTARRGDEPTSSGTKPPGPRAASVGGYGGRGDRGRRASRPAAYVRRPVASRVRGGQRGGQATRGRVDRAGEPMTLRTDSRGIRRSQHGGAPLSRRGRAREARARGVRGLRPRRRLSELPAAGVSDGGQAVSPPLADIDVARGLRRSSCTTSAIATGRRLCCSMARSVRVLSPRGDGRRDHVPVGDLRQAFVDADDIAAVAARALTEEGHAGRPTRSPVRALSRSQTPHRASAGPRDGPSVSTAWRTPTAPR